MESKNISAQIINGKIYVISFVLLSILWFNMFIILITERKNSIFC